MNTNTEQLSDKAMLEKFLQKELLKDVNNTKKRFLMERNY